MDTATFIDEPTPLRRRGITAGIAVSLVLHALLIFGYRISRLQPVEAPQEPARSMTVWLQPARPPEPVARAEPPPPPKEAPRPRQKRELARADQAPRANAPVSAPVVAAQPKPAESQAITLPPAADPFHPEQQPKQFDINAALKTARKVANEKDPARAGLPVAQLESHPLYPEDHETKLQKGVASAKKYDCLQAGAGAGLLAPLVWIADKHCKF